LNIDDNPNETGPGNAGWRGWFFSVEGGSSLIREGEGGGATRSRTGLDGFAIRCITALLSRHAAENEIEFAKKREAVLPFFKTGAGKESRTLDLNLGKVALYQLSYSRVSSLEL
jgi:hypothetical protein